MRLFALIALSASVAFAQVNVTTTQVTVPGCNGGGQSSYDVDVYRPTSGGPFALIGVAHGFQLSKAGMADVARDLAAQGAVVVVPQFPLLLSLQCASSDHARNGTILWAAMEQQRVVGNVDATRTAVLGHSAGGLSAWLTAAAHPMAAVVLFDPTDNNMQGANVSASVTSSTLFVFAPPASCNSQGNATTWFTGKPAPRAKLRVVGASHCDAQSPVTSTCTLACGGAAATAVGRQDRFREWAKAFFAVELHGSTACLATQADTEAMSGVIDSVDFQLGACAVTQPDAGVADAGSIDAGVALDAGFVEVDAGIAVDAGGELDSGIEGDAGVDVDAGIAVDAGFADAGQRVDAGPSESDGGVGEVPGGGGCGCSSVDISAVALLALMVMRRARRSTAP